MMKKMKALFVEEQGQGMTEYGLILGVIAVGVIAVIALLGDQIKSFLTDALTNLGGTPPQ
jgi:pilus assembly protein Flp/PilA